MTAPAELAGRIAGGSSTISRYPALFPKGFPTLISRAAGGCVWASTGHGQDREYVDWISALGANLLGYHNREVAKAVEITIGMGGPCWSLGSHLEESVAWKLSRLSGFADGQVRFFKTGTEACMAAVRVARAVTGRPGLLSTGYHGWSDQFVGLTPPAWGVPRRFPALARSFIYNDLPSLIDVFGGADTDAVVRQLAEEYGIIYNDLPSLIDVFGGADTDALVRQLGEEYGTLGGRVAAVILEPVSLDTPTPGFLGGLVRETHREGALVIFDEIITGARYAEFTACQHYAVTPDLLVLSKGIANGWPLAALIGNRELMRCFDVDWRPSGADEQGPSGPVYCSGTFSANVDALVACKATLRFWETEAAVKKIWALGHRLLSGLTEALEQSGLHEHVRLRGHPYRIAMEASDLGLRALLVKEMAERGHLVGTGWMPCYAHTADQVDAAVDAFTESCAVVREALGRGSVLQELGGYVPPRLYAQR